MQTLFTLLLTAGALLTKLMPGNNDQLIIGKWQNIENPKLIHTYTTETRYEMLGADTLGMVNYYLYGAEKDSMSVGMAKYEHRFGIAFPAEDRLQVKYLNPPSGYTGQLQWEFKRLSK